MRVAPSKGLRLDGPDGLSSPPEPFIEIDDAEADALISAGIGREYVDPDALGDDGEPVAPKEPVKPKGKKGVKPNEAPAQPQPDPVDAERLQAITEALELIDDEHLEVDGERIGKPKVEAIAEISGLADVTVEEIDAALAAKDAEGA